MQAPSLGHVSASWSACGCAMARADLRSTVVITRTSREDDLWPGPPRRSSRSASASKSTAICRPSSDTAAFVASPEWDASPPSCSARRRVAAFRNGTAVARCAAWHGQGDVRVRPRTQASLAVSADGEDWVLINASPDLPQPAAAIEAAASAHRNPRKPDQGGGAHRRRDRPGRGLAQSARARAIHGVRDRGHARRTGR